MLKDRSAKNTRGYFNASTKDKNKKNDNIPKRSNIHQGPGKKR